MHLMYFAQGLKLGVQFKCCQGISTFRSHILESMNVSRFLRTTAFRVERLAGILNWRARGVYKFFKICEPLQNSRHRKSDMKPVPYWGPTKVTRHCTHSRWHGDRRPAFVLLCPTILARSDLEPKVTYLHRPI
jgi:hypothetical protein